MSYPVFYFAEQLYAAMLVLTWKEEKRKHYLSVMLATAAAAAFVGLINDLTGASVLANFHLVLLLEAVGWYLTVAGSFQIVFFYYVAALLLQNGTYYIYSICYSLLGIHTELPEHLLHVVVFTVVYALFAAMVLPSFYRCRDCVILRRKTVAVTLIVFVINQLCEANVSHVMETGVTISFDLYSALCAFLALSLQFGVLWTDIFKTENERIADILDRERAQHRLSEENRDLINAKCHDLKQQVAVIRQMSERSEQLKGLEELEDAVMFYDHFLKTGSDALDLILAEKSHICEQNGIELICVAEGEALAFMDDIDIYTMFGNTLDNAIECLAGERQEKRRITLNVVRVKGMLSIHMENYCTQKAVFAEGLPQTTKGSSDYHGYGLKSVRFLAQKYGGTLTAAQEGEMFYINIVMPART